MFDANMPEPAQWCCAEPRQARKGATVGVSTMCRGYSGFIKEKDKSKKEKVYFPFASNRIFLFQACVLCRVYPAFLGGIFYFKPLIITNNH